MTNGGGNWPQVLLLMQCRSGLDEGGGMMLVAAGEGVTQLGCTHTNSSTYVECPSGPSSGRAEQLRGQEYTTIVPLHTA